MTADKNFSGHAAAFITIFIWGTTFVSTKILLQTFTPVEILFIRFLTGYAALWLVCPRFLFVPFTQEAWFAAAGLCGITLYYLLENIALTYTLASNAGVIISIAPFFTALANCLFLGGKRPGRRFIAGFLLAMAGICLLSAGGTDGFAFNPAGDLLAAAAAVIWALYATLAKKISTFGFNTIQVTRRTFFYGLLFMLPAAFFTDFSVSTEQLAEPRNLLNLLFLGLGASALCFVTWNLAVKKLGAVKTSVYIYLVPVITTAASVLILGERITAAALCGIALTLSGLFLSESASGAKNAPDNSKEREKRYGHTK